MKAHYCPDNLGDWITIYSLGAIECNCNCNDIEEYEDSDYDNL